MAEVICKTRLDALEPRDGAVQVRFAKETWAGDKLVLSEWHRTVFPDGVNVDAQVDAVSENLGQMGFPPIIDADVARIKAVHALV